MSARALNWAWSQMNRLDGQGACRAKLTLVALADRADDDGLCWPWVSTLAEKMNVSDDTVGRALNDLEQAGLMERTRRRRSNGTVAGWEFQLPLDSQPATLRDGEAQPDRNPAGSQTATLRGQETSIRDDYDLKVVGEGSAGGVVKHYCDLAASRNVELPRSVIARVGKEAKALIEEGFTEQQVKAGATLLLDKGMSPAMLPALVVQAQTASAVQQQVQPERKLSPFARAKQWLHADGWRMDEADLAEMLGRDFGIEGEAKQRLLEQARNVRASRAAA